VDLVLTDAVMPGVGGRELVTALRDRHPELPAVFMSGYTPDVARVRELVEAGAGFLAKPFGPAELLSAVRAGLGTRRT
jgi:FixJ family two-component response regulator